MITKSFAQNDTGPALDFTVKRDAVAVNLTGWSVRLTLRKVGASTYKFKKLCTLVSPTLGELIYIWASGDLDDPGNFDAELEFTDTDGKVETSDPFRIVVRKELG